MQKLLRTVKKIGCDNYHRPSSRVVSVFRRKQERCAVSKA